jgi:hypothetical protein
MPDLPGKAERDPEYREELKRLRQERRRRVEEMLHSDVLDRAPGNAAYWVAVVGGSFVLCLLLLLALAPR